MSQVKFAANSTKVFILRKLYPAIGYRVSVSCAGKLNKVFLTGHVWNFSQNAALKVEKAELQKVIDSLAIKMERRRMSTNTRRNKWFSYRNSPEDSHDGGHKNIRIFITHLPHGDHH